jgi:hypothetical protein
MVVWAAQPRESDSVPVDEPLVAGADSVAPVADPAAGAVEGAAEAAHVGEAECAGDVWLAAGPEGAVDGPGDFAWPAPGPAAALCASVVDAVVGVITTDGMAAAACWALKLAWSLLTAGVPAQAVAPRATATTVAPAATVATPRLRSRGLIHALMRLLDRPGATKNIHVIGHISDTFGSNMSGLVARCLARRRV